MNLTIFERGFQQGILKGQRQVIRICLEAKFGSLNESVLARLEAHPADRLEELLRALVRAASLAELGLADS